MKSPIVAAILLGSASAAVVTLAPLSCMSCIAAKSTNQWCWHAKNGEDVSNSGALKNIYGCVATSAECLFDPDAAKDAATAAHVAAAATSIATGTLDKCYEDTTTSTLKYAASDSILHKNTVGFVPVTVASATAWAFKQLNRAYVAEASGVPEHYKYDAEAPATATFTTGLQKVYKVTTTEILKCAYVKTDFTVATLTSTGGTNFDKAASPTTEGTLELAKGDTHVYVVNNNAASKDLALTCTAAASTLACVAAKTCKCSTETHVCAYNCGVNSQADGCDTWCKSNTGKCMPSTCVDKDGKALDAAKTDETCKTHCKTLNDALYAAYKTAQGDKFDEKAEVPSDTWEKVCVDMGYKSAAGLFAGAAAFAAATLF